jgi:DNA topoisomerase-1
MSDAKLERKRQNEANNHGEILRLQWGVAFEGFLKCTWKVMMTMKKSRRDVTGDESRKLHNNYITATERYSRPPARYTDFFG